jgi:hypothetical protein
MIALRTAVLAFLAMALAAPACAADLTGTWGLQVDLGAQKGAPTLVLQQTGTALSGTYKGALGEAPLKGKVTGDDFTLDFNAGGADVHYIGKVTADGHAMSGTADYGGQASGTFTGTKK